MTPDRLTARQQAFVAGVLAGTPAAAAYAAAGYDAKPGPSAEAAASRLLRNVKVAAVLDDARRAAAARLAVTAEGVLRELARVGLADRRTLFRPDGTVKPPHEWDDDAAAAVAGLDVEEVRGRDADAPADEPGGGPPRRRGRLALGRVSKVRTYDKVRALELLGKYLRLFADRHEHSGPGGGPVPVALGFAPEALRALSDADLDRRIAELEGRAGPPGGPPGGGAGSAPGGEGPAAAG